MSLTLAIDIYDTLIDVSRISRQLEKHCDGDTLSFARFWRSIMLGYTFRRGLMPVTGHLLSASRTRSHSPATTLMST